MNKINSHATKEERNAVDYYDSFVEKFKPKKTTDDCLTPEPVYQAVLDWARNEYNISPNTRIVRPFWPGGDYKAEDYDGDCVVIDNPPFSILSEICAWYQTRGIRFFLFAPQLTLFSIARGEMNYIVCDVDIVYENGARVNTSFITNMGDVKIYVCPQLKNAVLLAAWKLNAVHKPKYNYPRNVISSSRLALTLNKGIELKAYQKDVCFTRALDAQKEMKKGIFGAGFYLSDRIADKLVINNVNNATTWELSERERKIIEELSTE